MKYLNFKAIIAILSVSCVIFSCKKVATPDPIGDAGKTVIKVYNGGDAPTVGHKLLGIDFVSTPQTIDGFQVYRDAASNASLNTALTVTVKDDTAAITAYNTANGTHILPLPRSWYTTNFAVSAVGGNYTIPFAAGDYSQLIRLTIPNSTVLDPSSSYGIAFTLVGNSANETMSSGRTFLFEIGAKNAYDGIYSVVSGWVQRYSGPGTPTTGDALNGDLTGNADVTMTTVGATTVQLTGQNWAYAAMSGGIAGIDNLRATVDPSTNAVTMQSLANATLVNWTGFTTGPWDVYFPSTKVFNLAFRWVSTAPAYREYQIVLKYKGPR